MKKIIKLTESDLLRIVKKVINEYDETQFPEPPEEVTKIQQDILAGNYIKKEKEKENLSPDVGDEDRTEIA